VLQSSRSGSTGPYQPKSGQAAGSPIGSRKVLTGAPSFLMTRESAFCGDRDILIGFVESRPGCEPCCALLWRTLTGNSSRAANQASHHPNTAAKASQAPPLNTGEAEIPVSAFPSNTRRIRHRQSHNRAPAAAMLPLRLLRPLPADPRPGYQDLRRISWQEMGRGDAFDLTCQSRSAGERT